MEKFVFEETSFINRRNNLFSYMKRDYSEGKIITPARLFSNGKKLRDQKEALSPK